jgi:hypothetical protein
VVGDRDRRILTTTRAAFAHRLRHTLATKAMMPAMPRAFFIHRTCPQAIYATYRTVLRIASLHIYLT